MDRETKIMWLMRILKKQVGCNVRIDAFEETQTGIDVYYLLDNVQYRTFVSWWVAMTS